MKNYFKLLLPVLFANVCFAQKNISASSKPPAVIAYFAGRPTMIDSFAVNNLSHLIFSFCHLKGNELSVSRMPDTLVIRNMVALKEKNPNLKVILSLGGWGGCKTCSEVFSTKKGRREFVRSVKHLTEYFHTDGIDLDWEYPALVNIPGYPFMPEDKDNFTALVKKLRKKMGADFEISFAAGGYTDYINHSIDWKNTMRYVDIVNLMTYDLVGGDDTVTGHHTSLYSTPGQLESTDHAIKLLDSIGVPRNKMAIGVAFYARIFQLRDSLNYGLYRPSKFFRGLSYRDYNKILLSDSGYVYRWDSVAQAPYMYNASKQLFVTFDDTSSIRIKTKYAIDNKLYGVMFWQLADDSYTNGLLDIIVNTNKEYFGKNK
ncbi:MAG TPA: glycosyl hydrolase family 18 protein [Puia sp.]|jgi:chitinase|nr:glycosyl hydrolase family 18 protein [Puia sp.]